MEPEPGEDQHDESDGEAEDEPGAEVDHLCVRVASGRTQVGHTGDPVSTLHHNTEKLKLIADNVHVDVKKAP